MYKKLLFQIATLCVCVSLFAQSPNLMNYQAVVRNNSGNLVANGTQVKLRMSIHDLTATGTIVYTETITATANQFGLVNVQIGAVNNLATVNWGGGAKYLQVETDVNNTGTFTDMGASQLISVPYALYAANGNAGPQGPTGPIGPQGLAGLLGSNGATGNTGSAGANGANGTTGVTGDTGLQGTIGATGDTGLQGDIGVTGTQGVTGANGIDGTNGLNGADGAQGATGFAPSGSGIVTVNSGVLNTPSNLTGAVTTSGAGLVTTITDGAVTLAKIIDIVGLSVLGNPTNTSASPSAITAGTDNHVLRRASSTSLGFGLIGNASISDLAWAKLTGVPATFAPSAGSGNYIQNGTSAQAADYNITGIGTIGGTLDVAGNTTTRGIWATTVAATGSNVLSRTGGGQNWFPFTDGNNYISADLTRIRTAANVLIADFTGTGVEISGTLSVDGNSDFNSRTRVVDAQFWLTNAAGTAVSPGIGTAAGEFLVVGANGRVARTNLNILGTKTTVTRTNSTWTVAIPNTGSNHCMLAAFTYNSQCSQRINAGNIEVRAGNTGESCTWVCISY